MSAPLTHSLFADQVGSRFRVLAPPGPPVDVELTAATLLPAHPRPGAAAVREPFSLLFRAPMDCRLPQKIYRLEHDSLGALDVFLVPIGPDAAGMRFEAIFN